MAACRRVQKAGSVYGGCAPRRAHVFQSPAAARPAATPRRQNTGDRLRHSFGRQHSQLARAVSTYQKNFGLPQNPQHVIEATLAAS